MITQAQQQGLESAIPVGEQILLDTTSLAAYLDRTESVHPVALHILDAFVASGRNEAVVSMVTMMEILVRPLRSSPPGNRTVLSFVRHHPNLETVPLDLQMALEAASLRASYRLRPPDALVVGTAIACRVSHLVTNDHAWAASLAPLAARIGVVTLSDFTAADAMERIRGRAERLRKQAPEGPAESTTATTNHGQRPGSRRTLGRGPDVG